MCDIAYILPSVKNPRARIHNLWETIWENSQGIEAGFSPELY